MFRDILLPIDFNHDSSWTKALPTALELVRSYGARLHVITVVPAYGLALVGDFFPADFEHRAIESAREVLHRFTAEHVPEGVPVQHIVAHGTVYREILDAANGIGADLIVMASHRPGLGDYLLGPNAARVVRHAACSVLVVRE